MQSHVTELAYVDLADVKICHFIRKLRERYGPLDPDVNEDYRNFLINEGVLGGESDER